MGIPAPKPRNYAALVASWDDPRAFAHEVNLYREQLDEHRREVDAARELPVDITQPRRQERDD